MLSRLPGWIWFGGGVLAFIAGMVNVVALLGFEHQAVSHVTGSSSQVGVFLVSGEFSPALRLLSIIGSFFLGAVLSGMIVRDSALHFGRMYGVALMTESLLLALAIPLIQQQMLAGDCLASAACGLQNAMATTYSGAILRTTHMTGILTDLGIALGRCFMGLGLDRRKFGLLGTIFIGFLAGSAAGAYGYHRLSYFMLAVPAVICGVMGLGYTLVRIKSHHPPPQAPGPVVRTPPGL